MTNKATPPGDGPFGTLRDEDFPRPPRPRGRGRILVAMVALAMVGTIVFGAWPRLYNNLLETSDPVISAVELPRGVGLAPVTFRFDITEWGAGLDEYVVRLHQRGRNKELQRKNVGGEQHATVEVPFTGDRSLLEEGAAELEIRAFDRSLWSNSAERRFQLRVDYRKPRVDVLSTQHNAREGGSQLLFYRVIEENPAVSGVRVDQRPFLGVVARGIDPDFEDDRSLNLTIYAVPLGLAGRASSLRVFAEDEVGNATSAPFANKVHERAPHQVTVPLREEYLREHVSELVVQNFSRIQSQKQREGVELELRNQPGSEARMIEELNFVNKELRESDDAAVRRALREPRLERYWDGPFVRQPGAIRLAFGDRVTLTYEGKPADTFVHAGYTIDTPRDQRQVIAANEGIVAFSDSIGAYRRVVAVDHGLGVTSLYAHLEDVSVQAGARVAKGQQIGVAGRGGLFNTPHIYFEVRVQGEPVDPVEWMDARWFAAHIEGKTDEMRRALGIPTRRQLR